MSKVARFKFMYQLRIVRNCTEVFRFRRRRDLLTWRGMSVIAGLISQGEVGSDTSAWKVYVSGNTVTPNMGDDSGEPLTNELNPSLGTPQPVTWNFSPSEAVSGEAQLVGTLTLTGIVTVTTEGNIRKIGIIDSGTPPNQRIVVEDSVVPQSVIVGDNVEITYFLQFG